MASEFLSERLIYRGLEDTPRDKAFILSILSDRASSENATTHLVKPVSSTDVDNFMRGFRDCFLGVLVCTPNPSTPLNPNIIGYLNLQHTTQPHHRSCTMSIRICPEAQGRGYGSEAIKHHHHRVHEPKANRTYDSNGPHYHPRLRRPVSPTTVHDFIHTLGGVRDAAVPTRLRLSRGGDHVWVYGPEGENAGGSDVELEAEYELKLGNRPTADVTLEMPRSGGGPELARDVVEAAVGRWGAWWWIMGRKVGCLQLRSCGGGGGKGTGFRDWEWGWK
ncbi:hypothetical protein V502_10204 [Pseudogymnoascus sp. VKM F-4520 (FW-2644)]|nr:hypothetical protein V502_10204 [Pseudogymnoascus sp. VKM F-4520 (FW-2644)]